MLRKIAIVAVLIAGLQVCQILALGPTNLGSFLSNDIQTLSSFLAAAMCFATLRRSHGMCSFVLAAGWPGNRQLGSREPGLDVLRGGAAHHSRRASAVRFLFEAPLMFFTIALFLDPERDSPRFSAELLLDFLQIIIVFSFLFPLRIPTTRAY